MCINIRNIANVITQTLLPHTSVLFGVCLFAVSQTVAEMHELL